MRKAHVNGYEARADERLLQLESPSLAVGMRLI